MIAWKNSKGLYFWKLLFAMNDGKRRLVTVQGTEKQWQLSSHPSTGHLYHSFWGLGNIKEERMKKARERTFWAWHDHRNQHLKAAASSVWTGPWQDRVHHESVRDQIKWRLSGPHHTLSNYWLLVHSGRKAVMVFTSVPRDAPTEFQRIIWNSLVIQKSLVKLRGSHDKTIQ